MSPQLKVLFICELLLLFCCCDAVIVVQDEVASSGHTNEGNASAIRHSEPTPTYRISVAIPKQPLNRVPAHLQDIRAGFAYDDFDDVIHIIEPPQHFQHLKRMFNQKGFLNAGAAVWEQRPKVRTAAAPTAPIPTINKATKKPAVINAKMKVSAQKQQQLPLPLLPQQRYNNAKVEKLKAHRKPAAAATGTATVNQVDLLAQETYVTPESNLQKNNFPLNLPTEILASVRKTERIVHNKRPVIKRASTLTSPAAKQRIQNKRTHTVIIEKQYEQAKFQQGKERRAQGEKLTSRGKRVARAASDPPAKQRSKREIVHANTTRKLQEISKNNIQKGTELLLQINELLENASYYLPEHSTTNETSETTKNRMESNDLVLGKRVTLQQQQNVSQGAASTQKPNDDITKSTSRGSTRYGEQYLTRSSPRTSAITHSSPATFSSNIRRHAIINTAAITNEGRRNANNSEKLLYDDIMENIQNMLQANNLKSHDNDQDVAATATHLNAAERSLKSISAVREHDSDDDDDDDYDDNIFQHFNQYLSELQQIVKSIPTTTTTTTKPIINKPLNELKLNTAEFLSGSDIKAAIDTISEHEHSNNNNNKNKKNKNEHKYNKDWYLIDDAGEIYETNLSQQLKPSISIFHRFPDIPNADDYLRNRTLFSNTFEIL